MWTTSLKRECGFVRRMLAWEALSIDPEGQKLLGHESVRTTEKYYAHLSPDSFTPDLIVLNGIVPKAVPGSSETGSKSVKEKTVNLLESWCRGRESNPHDPCGSQDFKSCASASFATPA